MVRLPQETFLSGRVVLHPGDCLEVMAGLEECSVDSCVTDPPYHLVSIVQRFGADDAAPARSNGATGVYARASSGFMSKRWDGGDARGVLVAFDPATWRAVYRVLKPGAYLLAMGGTRTYHRLACAIEDAGFEVRDMIAWTYGSGFPKSHDVSKGIDRAAGAEREVVGLRTDGRGASPQKLDNHGKGDTGIGHADGSRQVYLETAPATDAARQWDGWGTALKPALEPICMARKPLSESTVAANVMRWGTGAINVDGCRIEASKTDIASASVPERNNLKMFVGDGAGRTNTKFDMSSGRWPANLIHDGSEDVRACFPDAGGGYGVRGGERQSDYGFRGTMETVGYGDEGSAARFFYTAKADADDRLGSKHPTVKPLDLMQYLVRLVTPARGLVLDPFAGTGTTGEAAWREGMSAVLIEAEAEYQNDIRRRMALALSGPDERTRESIKAKNLPRDDGPLFGGIE